MTASGTTQTSASADTPQTLASTLSSINIVGGWAYVGGSATGQKLFWKGSAAGDFFQVAVDGTTLTYELTSLSDGSHYFYQTTITLNTWFHVAFEKSSSVCYAWLNGVLLNSAGTTFSSFSPPGQFQVQRDMSAGSAMRYVFASQSGTGGDTQAINSIRNSFSYARVRADWFGFFLWHLLPGGTRLIGTSWLGGTPTLQVWGTVPEVDDNPPSNWAGQDAIWFKTAPNPIPSTATTQTMGSATLTAAAAVSGTTQTTGSAVQTITYAQSAGGSTATFGIALMAGPPLVVGSKDGMQTGTDRRWEGAVIARRKARR